MLRWMLIAVALLLSSPAAAGPPRQAVAEDPDLTMAWQMNLADLVPAWGPAARIEGTADVALAATVDRDGVHRLFRVQVPEVFIAGTPVGGLAGELWAPADAQASLRVALRGPAGAVSLEATLALDVDLVGRTVTWAPGPAAATLELRGLDLGELGPVLFGAPLAGRVSGEVSIRGDSRAPTAQGAVLVEEATWRGAPLGDLSLALLHNAGRTRLDARLGALEDPLVTLTAELPLDFDPHGPTLIWRDAEEHRISIVAGVVGPETLRPLWAVPDGVDVHLGFVLEAAGTLDDFEGSAVLEGVLDLGGDRIDVETRFDVTPTKQHLRFALGADELVVDLAAEVPLVAVRRSGASVADAPLRGVVAATLPAGRMVPFLGAGVDAATGHVSAAVDIDGTLGAPGLHGTLSLDDAAFTFLPIGRRLRGVTGRGRLTGNALEIEELVALATPGEIQGGGTLTWQVTDPGAPEAAPLWSTWSMAGAVDLQLVDLPVVREGLPVALFTGGVTVGLSAAPGERAVEVGVTEGAVLLTDDEVAEVRAVPTNPAVQLIGLFTGATRDRAPDGREVRRMSLSLLDPVHVVGPEVELDLEGTLAFERVGPRVHVTGGLDVAPGGRFDLFENRFELRAGRLTLAEGHLGRETGPREARPLEPVLDVVARGRVQGTHVLLRVSGPGHRPDLILLSSPALPEFQIMTLLILGRVDVVDDRNGEVRRQIAKIIERYHSPDLKRQLANVDGILIPGGFGDRGSEGKIDTVRYARENNVPFFGLCLGMQIAVIEFARNVCGLTGANSTEFNRRTKHPVIDLLPEQRKIRNMGATMRLGAYPCMLKPGTFSRRAYGKARISERHRHRYELNNKYRRTLEKHGMTIAGEYEKKRLGEIVEISDHPWFVATQFHPEFKSRPLRAHPLFRDFVKAAKQRSNQ